MREIDLTSDCRYPPLDAMSSAELFSLGVTLACTLPGLEVRTPAGDEPDEAVTLCSKLLCKKGCRVY